MKLFYTLFNFVLIGVLAGFGWLHYHYREHNQVKVVTETLIDAPAVVAKSKRPPRKDEVNYSLIAGVFNRERARLEDEENAAKVVVKSTTLPLVLTGIMRFGTGGGAMIRPVESSKFEKVSSKMKKKVVKKYFKIGDTVYNNYKLIEMGDDFVKLSNGVSEATLKLDKKSLGGPEKATEEQKVKFSVLPVK